MSYKPRAEEPLRNQIGPRRRRRTLAQTDQPLDEMLMRHIDQAGHAAPMQEGEQRSDGVLIDAQCARESAASAARRCATPGAML
jgi:hypothetical protein